MRATVAPAGPVRRRSLSGVLRVIIPMVFRASPAFFMLFALVAVLHGVSWGATVLGTQRFFDAVERAVADQAAVPDALWSLLALAVVTIWAQVVNALHSFVYTPFNQCCIGYLTQRVHLKTADMNPVEYEDPGVLDSINKCSEGIRNVFGTVFTTVMTLTFFLPYVVFMGAYLLSYEPVLAVAVALLLVPAAASQLVKSRSFTTLEDQSAPVRREFEYYEQCICGREYLKETRILGAYGFLRGLYQTALALLNTKQLEAERRTFLVDLCTKVITLAGYLGVLLLLVRSVLADRISIGMFAAVFAGLAKTVEMVGGFVGTAGSISRDLGSVRNFLAFLDVPDRRGEDVEVDFRGGITAEDVAFRYPAAIDPIEETRIYRQFTELCRGKTAILVTHRMGSARVARRIVVMDQGRIVEVGGHDELMAAKGKYYEMFTAQAQWYNRADAQA